MFGQITLSFLLESCYNPKAAVLFTNNDYLTIDCMTSSTAQMTLSGVFNGSSSGTTSSKGSSTTTTANGINYYVAMNSGTTNAIDALVCFLAGDYAKGVFKGAMSLWNFGNALLGKSTYDYETIEEQTGSINQSFNGQIDLSGYITQSTSNNAQGVQFKYNAFNKDAQACKGVWSLQNNPVVYVVDDLLIGDDWEFKCDVKKDYYGYGGDPGANNFNLFTFFDPTSIVFNINTDNIKEISNAEMTWTYGVYPKQGVGHTTHFRTLLRTTLPHPKFVNSENDGKMYSSISSSFANMKYMEYPIEDMAFVKADNSQNDIIELRQEGSKCRYFGYLGNEKDTTVADCFVLDPVVTLPSENGKFYDFEIPDFVVGVMLKFNYRQSDGKIGTAIFSKRFIPEVRTICITDMQRKYDALKAYCNGTQHQKANGVTITHRRAKEMLQRFFKTAEYIKKYDFE